VLPRSAGVPEVDRSTGSGDDLKVSCHLGALIASSDPLRCMHAEADDDRG
jgi:hypothetical protein